MTPLTPVQKALIVIVLSGLVFFSFFRITESPPFNVDEGWAVQVATNISERGIDGLQFSPGNIEHISVLTSVGYPFLYSLALWFKFFGSGLFQARVMMAFSMFAFAVVSFTLLRRLYGNVIAISSLALLATFPPFYTFGKSVYAEVPVLFFLVLSFLCFNLAFSNFKRRHFWLALAGISAGLCIVTKTMALVLMPILFVIILIAFLRRILSYGDVGVLTVGALVPIIIWILSHFQPGDSLASAFDYYSNPSALTNRVDTFWLNLGMFVGGIGPLYMLFLISVWATSVVIRVKAAVKIHSEEFVALLFSFVLMISFLFRYWDARYLFPVQVLGILFAPYSIYSILLSLPIKLNIAKKERIFSIGITALSILGLYQTLFHSFIADSYKSTYTAELAAYFSSVPDDTSLFFYNTTQVVPFFRGRNYYQRITMFKKWVLGNEYAPIVKEAQVDMLVLGPPMLQEDAELSLSKYYEVAKFREIRVLRKK